MSDAVGASAPAPAGTEMSPFQKLVGVFFSPAKTFESVARKPGWDWLVPVALLVVLVLVAVFTVNPKLDVGGAVSQAMKRVEQRQDLGDAQRERAEAMIRGQFKFMVSGPGRFIAPLFVIVPLFLVPLLYHGVAAAFGSATRYGTVLAGYAWVQMVQFVKGLIGLGVALPRSSIDVNEAQNLVRSNVGAFLDPDTTSRSLMSLAASVDLFEIWALVLGSIMLARTTRLSKNAATATVVALWVVWILLKAAGAAFGG